ncbi:MAG: DNA-processing protein DprA [Planctomycetota bacterium]
MNNLINSLENMVTLNSAHYIGSVLYQRLVQRFGSLEKVFKASSSELQKVPGIGPKLAPEIIRVVQEKCGEQELALAQKSGVKIITCEDEQYPRNLKTIFDYPILIYVKGDLQPADFLAVALVGSRRASYYGLRQAERFAGALAQRGVCVVSGLARGIDTAAHSGALKIKNGRTIAVLGSGLNRIYPPENKKLAQRISESGALVSELPLNAPPDSRNFPVRNRIISGLSLGVVVVEAPVYSGALITADLALDQGREVFALPGKVDSSTSQGCHRLIKMGAKLVENVDDIIEEFGPYQSLFSPKPGDAPGPEENKQSRQMAGLDYREKIIWELLSPDESKNIEDIIEESKLPPALVSSTLLVMELKKIARQLPGKNFLRY